MDDKINDSNQGETTMDINDVPKYQESCASTVSTLPPYSENAREKQEQHQQEEGNDEPAAPRASIYSTLAPLFLTPDRATSGWSRADIPILATQTDPPPPAPSSSTSQKPHRRSGHRRNSPEDTSPIYKKDFRVGLAYISLICIILAAVGAFLGLPWMVIGWKRGEHQQQGGQAGAVLNTTNAMARIQGQPVVNGNETKTT
ncbi:hypothetical protein BDV06DRAFT_224845 [Aspergillus oleicola]